jgi:ankyrin repeat protein
MDRDFATIFYTLTTDQKTWILDRSDDELRTLFNLLVIKGRLDLVQLMPTSGDHIHIVDQYTLSPIMNAIKFKHWSIVEYLLKYTDATINGPLPRDEDIEYEWLVNIKTITNQYLTAARTNNWKMMLQCLEGPDRDVIKKGMDYDTRATAVQIAAEYGHLNIVKNIVEGNLLAPFYYDDLYSIATQAATFGKLPVVEYIFNHPNFIYETFNYSGFKRIDFDKRVAIAIFGAVTNGHLNVVKYLCRYTPNDELKFVAMDCTQTLVLNYLHKEGHINVHSDIGAYDSRTYLSRAARKGNLKVVQWLVNEMKVDVKVSGGNNETPLMAAFDEDGSHDYSYDTSTPKSFETASWLMKNSEVKIDDVVEQETGRTVVMVACQLHDYQLVENILKHTKVDLSAVDNAGQSVWDMVAWDNPYVEGSAEKVFKIMFLSCEHVPDSFKDRYPGNPSFQSLIEKGQILRDRIKLYQKQREEALQIELSTLTKKRPEGIPNVLIQKIRSFDELTFSEKWYVNKRRTQ